VDPVPDQVTVQLLPRGWQVWGEGINEYIADDC
jgi:hypothetical protein